MNTSNWFRRVGCFVGAALMVVGTGCNEQINSDENASNVATSEQAVAANAITVSMQVEVTALATAVWETVGNFNGWDKFLSAVENTGMYGQGVGATRFLSVSGQTAPVVEREDVYDAKNRVIAYTILSSPLPVDDYHSVMRVVPVTNEVTRIEWSSHFKPKNATREEARTFITDFYTKGLADLQSLFTPKVSIQKYIAAKPDAIWTVVGDFNGLGQFVTNVAASHLVKSGRDTFRILDFNDGATQVIEHLDSSDTKNTTVTYSIVTAPLPFENYTSTIQIVPQGEGSLVTWTGRYNPIGDPTNADQFLRGLYTGGLETLSDLLAP